MGAAALPRSRGARNGTTSAVRPAYGGFLQRALACCLDGLILGIPMVSLSVAAIVALRRADTLAAGAPLADSQADLVTLAVYLLWFWARRGWTPGKRAVGLCIVGPDGRAGDSGYRRAALRLLGYLASYYAAGLGFLWIIWDREKRGVHDMIAGTRVVPLRDAPALPPASAAAPTEPAPAPAPGGRPKGSQSASRPARGARHRRG